MYAIAFDLITEQAGFHHKKGVRQAYSDIKIVLKGYGFEWVQGGLYINDNEDMANLFNAINALKMLDWFPASVRYIRTFRLEQWSDFTPFVKNELP